MKEYHCSTAVDDMRSPELLNTGLGQLEEHGALAERVSLSIGNTDQRACGVKEGYF